MLYLDSNRINLAKERMVCGFSNDVAKPDYVRYSLKARDGHLNKDFKPFVKWDNFKKGCTAKQWFDIIEETYDYLHEVSGPNVHCGYFYESHEQCLISCLVAMTPFLHITPEYRVV